MERLFSHRLFPVALLATIVLVAPMLFPSAYYYRVAALVFVFGFAAIGLNLLMGYAGQVSLGHAGFMGIGAFTTAILPTHFGTPVTFALLVGPVLAGLLAFIVGRPILKLKGPYLAVATLGLGVLIAMVLTNEARFTGGPDGMSVPRLELFGWRVRGGDTWYWLTGAVMVIGAWLASNLIDSPTGRALRAIHDSEVAARVSGIDIARYKLSAFIVSAVFAAIAGSELALLNGHITPDGAGFLRSIELVTMVVLGGMGSILGSVVGAAILTILPQALTVFHEYEHLMLGLIMMVCMIFLREGVVPSVTKLFGRRT